MTIASRSKAITITGLLAVLALTATGCSMLPSPGGTGVAGAVEAASSYGDAVGSGEMVTTPSGTYERIKLSEKDPAYNYAPLAHRDAWGWMIPEATAAQKLAVDYMTQEFLDSAALEGGDTEFSSWHAATGKDYFSESILPQTSQNPGETKVILGNFGANKFIPTLIHDGSPRLKDLDLDVAGSGFVDENGDPVDEVDQNGNLINEPIEAGLVTYLKYSIEFNAGYRVDDVNGAAFVGQHVGMTGDEVLASKYATDKLKDGNGENVYRAKGYANVVVAKEPGGLRIIGFESKTDFDTRDFANQDAV
ncbi:hypothetical protein [Arthrobacter sp. UYCo732]|uniref:hypothetical protein n=1 Tax=Arthrobacter sp. UYCo732 TaxID=3156336 RepID=UPI0033988B2D